MGSKSELLDAMKFVERGQIRGVVDRTLPLSEARHAHELMMDRAQFGKLVLMPPTHN
jgi:NADPH:quinone reductase-like Zn-dependent oxidoreductase